MHGAMHENRLHNRVYVGIVSLSPSPLVLSLSTNEGTEQPMKGKRGQDGSAIASRRVI